ncbi:ATPase [Parafrankia colletiae]|uniref:ATPase n=1 Tax=Parafrankia colletiae TaxID=573497 RepID=A0A1S1QYM6_9ACTN|nr:MoxR family ATPase [Parafrankia colletiae]MCK9899056.1 MoxR family ATPase [Frankia sp. Cpl3]OHV38629.1 ATPase [Parafrankia colletiae]
MTESLLGPDDTAWFAERGTALVRNVETLIRGKTEIVRLVAVCLAAEGHVLIDDVPGTGKTSLAKAVANSIAGTMRRIQFTPDLLPTDVTGVQVWNTGTQAFEFQPGPVFGNVILADEVNRASPKTQSALLEVMEEQQVTVDGKPIAVPRPFLVVATQNPVEHGGTYDLPEAQIDRFMMRLTIGYPDHGAEVEVLANRRGGRSVDAVAPVLTTADIDRMIGITRRVHLSESLLGYIVTLAASTRRRPEVRLGVSTRGALALAAAAQAHAAADSRTYATPDDVKALAPYVLGHRVLLRPEAEMSGLRAVDLIGETVAAVPVPSQRLATR